MSSPASLNDSLQLIFPHLPEELVPAGERQRLSDTARVLAPIHCAGFECRLGAGETPVDLQQRILARDGEQARLVRHITSGPLALQPAWQSLHSFGLLWQPGSSILNDAIGGCWLELDAGGSAPSVFLSLRPLLGRRRAGDEVLEIANCAAVRLIGGPLPQGIAAIVRACVDGSPQGAGATDLGFMLGRRADAVRFVVGPLERRDVSTYLRRVDGFSESRALERLAIEEALAALPDSAEQVLVSLDIGTSVLPSIGLEYFPGGQPGDEAPWRELLGALVGAGLCTVDKRAALLRWPGYLEPGAAEGPWPASLLVESLVHGLDRFSVLGRRLNHVKIVCRPDSPLEAKAYFGFGPLWLQPAESGEGGSRDRPQTSLRGGLGRGVRVGSGLRGGGEGSGPRGRLESALQRGVDFLLESRGPEGLWLDFESVVGGSDEWVSAYTGTILATLPHSRSLEAAQQTWEILCRRLGDSDGWAYNSRLPADADATVWALCLARAVRAQDSEPALRGERFLDRHVRPDGSIASYTSVELPALQRFLGDVDMQGLCGGHDCVTSAAASLPRYSSRATEFLMSSQRHDGWWEGYWWCDHEYATALAVDGLLARAAAPVEISTAWAVKRFGSRGAVHSEALRGTSPFATALCGRILLATRVAGNVPASLALALEWLLRHQLEDGSWQESALMRVPPAYVLAPGAEPQETFFALDRRRIFTTATVLWTLRRALTQAGDLV